MKIVWDKVIVFALCLLPLVHLIYKVASGHIGPNPVEMLTHKTGIWAFRFLLLTLMVTPWVKFSGFKRPLRFRRMIGLFAFFYALLHFLVWIVFDHGFDVVSAWLDIADRLYLILGLIGFVGLIALAVTSPKAMVKKLGRRWKTLHKSIYLIGLLVAVHFYLRFKIAPWDYWLQVGILGVLLAYRLPWVNRALLRLRQG